MPRIARAVAVGHPHHITQRGNYRQNVFEAEQDYEQYLLWLREYSAKYRLKIWAYCLMGNHVHFIAVPLREDSMSRTFNTLHMRYSQRHNTKKKTAGHLWQGRFYSCLLDERHLHAAVRYVENNPVRAGIVKKPHRYKWSSAAAHVEGRPDPVMTGDLYLADEIKDWLGYLTGKEDEKLTDNIRDCTRTGRPCGEEGFIRKMEARLKRRLMALPPGRPRNVK